VDNVDNDAADVDVTHIITILSVSPFEEDHIALERIFGDAETTLYPNCRVRIVRCSDRSRMLSALDGTRIPVVICDTEDWEQTARELQGVSAATCLILSARSADDRLCAETARHGVYDVLAKPFRNSEVLRVIKMAWLHWQNRYGLPSAAPAAGVKSSGESRPQENVIVPKHCSPDQSQNTEE
jgi:DNA-binding response OmpR family regulator